MAQLLSDTEGLTPFLVTLRGSLPLTRHREDIECTLTMHLKNACHLGSSVQKGFALSDFVEHLFLVCAANDPHRYAHKPLDMLRFGRSELDVFTRPQLKRIAKRAARLARDIDKLGRTPMIAWLQIEGKLGQDDVLSLAGIEGFDLAAQAAYGAHIHSLALAERFRTAIRIAHLSHQYGRSDKRLAMALTLLCRYTRRTTGSWRDGLLADILSLLGIPHSESEGALRQWRHRNSVT